MGCTTLEAGDTVDGGNDDNGSDGRECSEPNAGRIVVDLTLDLPSLVIPAASESADLPPPLAPAFGGGGNMFRYARTASEVSAFGN